MAQRKITLALTGLYLLVCQAWATMEVSMEDRVEVFLDSVAEIPCIYKLNKPTNSTVIQWFVKSSSASDNRVRIYYLDSTGVIVDQGTGFSGRINVSHFEGSTEETAVLVINGVRVSDDQEYICQVNMDGESQEGRTRLRVFNAPSSPTIETGSYTSVNSARPEKIASCEVTNGYPTPNITWYKDRMPQNHIENVVNIENTVTENPSGLFTVHSELYLKVKKEDKDADFYCEVTYAVPGAEKMTESKRVQITVYYPMTTVSVTQESPERLVKEGDRVELRCQGDGNPQPSKSFMHNNNTINSEEGLVVLQQVTRLDSGLYECNAFDLENYVDMTGRFDLIVHYLDPVVITPEKPDSLDEGQDLSLTCNALSSLPTQAQWYKDDVLLKMDHVLTLNNVSYDTAGTYVCEVVTFELADLRTQSAVHINVRGKPMLTQGLMQIPVDTEGYVNVSCSATGHPVPIIQWNLTDEQALLNEWSTVTGNSIVSTVSITAASDITVSCMATNELGTAAESIHIEGTEMKTTTTTTTTSTTTSTTTASGTVTPQKKTVKEGNGVIIAVIIIFILMLAILGSVLYFLYKKGRISCGRSGKQDLTKEKASSDDIVVEMKSSKSEEAVLLQGVNGDKKISGNQ